MSGEDRDAAPPPARRLSKRFLLISVFVVFAALGALGRLAALRLEEYGPVAADLPTQGAGPAVAATPPLPAPDAASGAAPDEPSVGRRDHFAGGESYGLDVWTLDDSLAGAVSHVSIAGPHPVGLADRALAVPDVLVITGWAGEPVLGMPLSHVLFSLCGQIFGATPVDEPRPDIRRFVHTNLTAAGWSARLPVAALPDCLPGEVPLLRVWAARDGHILYPLEGATLLSPPKARGLAAALAGGRSVLRPGDLPPLERRHLTMTDGAAPLRRCPRLDCAVVGKLGDGAHEAVLLDHAGRWTLLVAENQAGWLDDTFFRLVIAAPAEGGEAEAPPPPPAEAAAR